MTTKMKLLDYTLIGLLASLPPLAQAQDAQSPSAATPPVSGADCTGDECSSEEGLLFRLRTLGD